MISEYYNSDYFPHHIVLILCNLSYDVVSGSDITPCIIIDDTLVFYIFSDIM